MDIDTYGVRRGTKVMQSRLRKAGQRAKGIRTVIAVNKDAKALVNTGFRPQAVWGMEAQGLSPTTLRRLRSLVAGMSGAKHPGGCATLAIRMAFTEEADPLIYRRLQLFPGVVAHPGGPRGPEAGCHISLESTCASAQDDSEALAKGQRVHIGSDRITVPSFWVDSDGEEFNLRTCDKDRLLDYALKGALNESIWQMASKHHLGKGLEHGSDLTVLRRHLRQLRRHGLHGHAGMLQMVASGALWPAARRFGEDDQGVRAGSQAHSGGP